eukprot:g118.t1
MASIAACEAPPAAAVSPQRPASTYNPKPQPACAPATPSAGTNGDRVVIVMVGLPARGKTYIARKIARYLEFFKGAPTAVFNAGEYRREAMKVDGGTVTGPSHDFFDQKNGSKMQQRMGYAASALEDLEEFMGQLTPYDVDTPNAVGRVGVFDATNTTRARRRWVVEQLISKKIVESRSHIIFIESICDVEGTIDENIRASKLRNPDYAGWDADKAVKDFKSRISHYEDIYERIDSDAPPAASLPPHGDGGGVVAASAPASATADTGAGEPARKRPRVESWHFSDESELSYVKLINSSQVVLNRINGYMQTTIVQFVMNLHTVPRAIYMSRHGQSEYNLMGKIGGDSSLTTLGNEYARALAKWVDDKLLPGAPHARLWTSSLRRTKETARHIRHDELPEPNGSWVTMRARQWNGLDELHAGIFDGMTYKEIEAQAPEEFEMRRSNKLKYRYPRGESYLDVIQRLEPIVQELERQKDPVLIVAHQGILRILYAYFSGMARERSPFISVPLHTVKVIDPHAYGVDEEDFPLLAGATIDVPSH